MLKTLIILPKKWKSLDKRVADLEKYLSRKDRLGSIYEQVKIDYKIMPLPDLKLNREGVYNKSDILAITKPFWANYEAVGVVFPFITGEKYAGNYYPNDSKEHKMDFYIKANEWTKQSSGYFFEEFIEHELAGHAVALDLGLTGQGTGLNFVEGADNTHFFFYGNNKEGHYKYINEKWKAKYSILSQMLQASSKLLDLLLKKN